MARQFAGFLLLCLLLAVCHECAASVGRHRGQHRRHQQAQLEARTRAVQQCCRNETNAGNIILPAFCCHEGLFDQPTVADEFPLQECWDQGWTEASIFSTIRCAQKSLHGTAAANVCKISCCDLLANLEPRSSTNCSRRCAENVRRVDMTVTRLLMALEGKCGQHQVHMRALENCFEEEEEDAEIACGHGIVGKN